MNKPQESCTYLVGGAVRDLLLGQPCKDKDYVVVGSTPESMISNGFKQVGSSFPVFLHPLTKEEYALARTERKSGQGYYGFETVFDPSITLEEDLRRRDLTINSMAMTDNGQLIDPFNGYTDLVNKVLRHTSEAFSEDPLRVLRVARFAARYAFTIAPETLELCRKIIESNELTTIPMERVWLEINKGFSEPHPEMMLQALQDFGAFDRAPMNAYNPNDALQYAIECLRKAQSMGVNDFFGMNVVLGLPYLTTLAEDEANRLRIPLAIQALAKRVKTYVNDLVIYPNVNADQLFTLITKIKPENDNSSDGWAKRRQAQEIVMVIASVSQHVDVAIRNFELLDRAVGEIRKIDFEALVSSCEDRTKIKDAVSNAKLEAVKKIFAS